MPLHSFEMLGIGMVVDSVVSIEIEVFHDQTE